MNRGLSHRVEGLTKQENGIPLPILSSPLSKVTSKRHKSCFQSPYYLVLNIKLEIGCVSIHSENIYFGNFVWIERGELCLSKDGNCQLHSKFCIRLKRGGWRWVPLGGWIGSTHS